MHLVQSDSSREADMDSSIQIANNTNIHFQSHKNILVQSFMGIHCYLVYIPCFINNNTIFNLIDDTLNNPGSDIERDTTRITILPPARIFLPTDSPVVQISCGLHHSGKSLHNLIYNINL